MAIFSKALDMDRSGRTMRSLDDVSDVEIRRAMDFMAAAVRLAPAKTASCIAQIIADDCLIHGTSTVSHKELERYTGTCRRTVQQSMRTLLARRVLRRVDRDELGRSTYICEWARGEEFRAELEARVHGK